MAVVWQKQTLEKKEVLVPGDVVVKFKMERDGSVAKGSIRITSKEVAPELIEMALKAVTTAKLPPIPDEVIPELKEGLFEMTTEFVIY